MGIIVRRPRLEGFLGRGGRRLLYGRRKTGKTFYARLVLRGHHYYIVRRGGTIYDPAEDYELSLRGFLRECGSGKVVLDEFHRAPPRLMDALQAGQCGGDLVLITSTLHYHRRFVEGPDAPLKGLFAERRVGLLSPLELLSTPGLLGGDPWGDAARLVFYQEPPAIGWGLEDVVESGWDYSKSLVGEILDEEDVAYTGRVDALLEAVAAGKTRLSEIASYLYSRGLLPKPSTGLVTKYILLATRLGLLERIPVWGRRRRSIYRHVSPLTSAAYYLQARYGFYDAAGDTGFGLRVVKGLLPRLVEQFAERFFAELYGLKPVKVLEPEVDIALVEYSRLRLVGEVKWRHRITRADVEAAESRLLGLGGHAVLVVPRRDMVPPTRLEVWDLEEMAAAAARWAGGGGGGSATAAPGTL